MSNAELKEIPPGRCPFCGEAEKLYVYEDDYGGPYVKCEACDAHGPEGKHDFGDPDFFKGPLDKAKLDALRRWNQRVICA